MPCFSTGPTPGTPGYEMWFADVQRTVGTFTHVVDYYYAKAGFPMPQPDTLERLREWCDGENLPPDAVNSVDAEENRRVLRQILLHLDCDGVDVFKLNEILNFLVMERTPQGLGYLFVAQHCFIALRNGFSNRPTTAVQ